MLKNNAFYNPKSVIKQLAWLGALLIVCMASQGIGFFVMIPVMAMAVVGRKYDKLFYVLLLCSAAPTMNGFFMPQGLMFILAQKIVMLGAGVVLLFYLGGARGVRQMHAVLWIFPYLIYMLVISQVGWAPIISNMKMLLYVITFMAFYSSATNLAGERVGARSLREHVLCLAIFFIIGSVLVYPFPGIAYHGREDDIRAMLDVTSGAVVLFKGMTKHSQAMGPMMAMLITLLFADLTFTLQKADKLYLTLLLIAPVLLYKTSSRTAMGSMFAGVGFVLLMAMRARAGKARWRYKTINFMILFVVIGSVFVAASPERRQAVAKFVTKNYGGDYTLTSENIMGSRQEVLDRALYNWREKPMTGNGFQVSEEMGNRKCDGLKDILTAPVEKSTWTYAILEEGGILGMILFCIFLLASIGTMVATRAYTGAALLFTFVIINLGEFGMFAMSMEGGFFWGLVFTGLVFDVKRLKEERIRRAWVGG